MGNINLNNYEAYLLDYFEAKLSGELIAELELFVITHPELGIELDEQSLPVLNVEADFADFKLDLKRTELEFPDDLILKYIEGKMPEAERQEFESNVLVNSKLARDLEQLKKTILVADATVKCDDKKTLLKTEDAFILNQAVISYVENILTPTERATFTNALLSDVILQKELNLVQKTKLVADLSIIYPDKAHLKKDTKVILFFSFRNISTMAAALLLLIGLALVFQYYKHEAVNSDELAHKNNSKQTIVAPEITLTPTIDRLGNRNEKAVEFKNMKIGKRPNKKVKSLPVQVQPLPEENLPLANQEKSVDLQSPLNNVAPKEVEQNQLADRHTQFSKPMDEPISDTSFSSNSIVMTILQESEDDADETPPKNSFWKKAVQVAKSANRLGVKSIDGTENPQQGFSLSFNSFSVERN